MLVLIITQPRVTEPSTPDGWCRSRHSQGKVLGRSPEGGNASERSHKYLEKMQGKSLQAVRAFRTYGCGGGAGERCSLGVID